MNVRIVILSLLYTLNIYAQDVSPDLQTFLDTLDKKYQENKDMVMIYSQDWQKTIATIRADLSLFSESEQQSLSKQLLSIEKTISDAVNQATQIIEKAYKQNKAAMQATLKKIQAKQLGNQAGKNELQQSLVSAIEAMARAKNILAPINKKLKSGPLLTYTSLKQGAEAQKKLAARKKMIAFYENIARYFSSIDSANTAAQKLIINYLNTNQISAKDIASITQQFETLLSQLSQTYKQQNITISFDQRSNYVSIVFRRLINFYLDDISATLTVAQRTYQELTRKKEDKRPYYHYFYELARRIQGTGKGATTLLSKGYKGEISKLAQQYFPTQVDVITNYFVQQKKKISIDPFGNALWDLSTNITDPTQQDATVATALYDEILDDLRLVEKTQAEQAAQQANSYMAALYLNRAQATLKKMVPKKDNTALLDIIIDSYQKSSSFFDKAKDTSTAQQYKNLADSLQQAKSNKQKGQQAEQANNVDYAIGFYKAAFQYFSVGGDTVDAAEMQNKWNELNAENAVKEGKAELDNFINTYKSQMQAYMAYISVPNLEEVTSLSTYDAMLSALPDACSATVKKYESAIASLETLDKPTKPIEDTIRLLNFLIDGFKHLSDGDLSAQGGSLESLNMAEYTDYPQALFNARNADEVYDTTLNEYISIFPLQFTNDQLNKLLKVNQTWNVALLFNRHIAKRYIEVSATLQNDATLVVQYFAAADGTRMIYLSNATELTLSNSLEFILSDSQRFQTLLKQAEDKQAQALKLPTQSWQQDQKVPHFYVSPADTAWKEVVKRFATLYRFGKNAQAREKFLNAVVAYAKTYQAEVPAEFYPSIGTAIIHFRQFVVYTIENQTSSAQSTLQEMQTLSKTFFTAAQELVKKVDNPDLITSATDNQQKVVEWKKRFEQTIADQDAIIAELAPKVGPQALAVFSKTVDKNTGNITCKMQPPGQTAVESITLTNPEVKLADLYKKLGESLYKKEQYKDSYYAYYYAMKYYRSAGKLDEVTALEDIYKKAYTRSIYHAYLDLVVPNKMYPHDIKLVQIAGVSVPEHYELYNSVQVIPTDKIPLPSNLVKLAGDKSKQAAEQIQELLQGYAYLVFLDKRLTDVGIDYGKVVRGTKLKPVGEITQAVSRDNLPLVLEIIESANYYLQKLKNRIKEKRSALHLLQEKEQFILAISYQPVLAATPITGNEYMTQKPYKAYYSADTYFAAVRALSNPKQPLVNYAGRSFTSGQEQAVYGQALVDIANTNLAMAGAYQRRLNYLDKGGAVDEVDPTIGYDEMVTLTGAREQTSKVKQVKKDDFSASTDPYQNTIELIRNYSKVIVSNYLNSAYVSYQERKDQKILSSIDSALSKNYMSAADILQNFLIGDPNNYFTGRGTQYSGLIVDIQHLYQLGYAVDQKMLDQAESKIAQMYENAGDLVAGPKKYFSALPFYQFAVSAYYTMQKPNQKNYDDAVLKLLDVYFKGSLEQLLIFRDAMVKPISMPEGGTLSLEDLITKGATDEDVQNKDPYKKIHDSLLDATIYFSDCSGWASNFAYPKGKPKDKDDDPITKGGKDFLSSYTKNNNISFEDAKSVIALVKRPDFAALMQGVFDQFSQKVRQATGQQDRQIGYAAIAQLGSNLYFALGKLYMSYYLSLLKPAMQFESWTSAIEGEKQNIIAPPEQWLGSQ